jgi:hypothetical protein
MNLGHIHWCKNERQLAIQNYRSSLKMSGSDIDWFAKVFLDDSKFLEQHGIRSIDIPLMIDYVRLSADS